MLERAAGAVPPKRGVVSEIGQSVERPRERWVQAGSTGTSRSLFPSFYGLSRWSIRRSRRIRKSRRVALVRSLSAAMIHAGLHHPRADAEE